MAQGVAFASGVPPDIYEFHLYTGNSTPPTTLKTDSIICSSEVKLRVFTSDLPIRLRALYAQ